ncbi:MAG: SprT-like domain-containing protein [Gammaproteobacteria bacterium]|nr:SprT-like domain-containing protein [Gammaproteobacteria bacterium]
MTEIIPQLTTEQQRIVIDETQAYIERATVLFALRDMSVDITFDLKGRSAGMYRVRSSKNRMFSFKQPHREIRYNPYIFSKYFDDNYASTIPHEVAHYVTDILYGLRNIKPHGKEWKAVMDAFDADASVTADYDLSGIPLKKQSLFTYHCDCREHQLSSIRHNRIKKHRHQYYCRHCKQTLKFKNELYAAVS